ncbi:hypothetical protein GQ53DRAFT_680684, partial [Thozetella sp. PMI_491]
MYPKHDRMRRNSSDSLQPALRPTRRYPASAPPSPKIKTVRFREDHLERVQYFLKSDTPLSIGVSADRYATIASPGLSADGRLRVNLVNFPLESARRHGQPARLEGMKVSQDGSLLFGSASVANLGYQKQVICRFTWDNWNTVSFVEAQYHPSARTISTPTGYDPFIFQIDLSLVKSLRVTTIICCLQYTVNGCEYWDNNDDSNFVVTFSDISNEALPDASKPSTTC